MIIVPNEFSGKSCIVLGRFFTTMFTNKTVPGKKISPICMQVGMKKIFGMLGE